MDPGMSRAAHPNSSHTLKADFLTVTTSGSQQWQPVGRAQPWRLLTPKTGPHDRPTPYAWYWQPIAVTSHRKYYYLGPGGLPHASSTEVVGRVPHASFVF